MAAGMSLEIPLLAIGLLLCIAGAVVSDLALTAIGAVLVAMALLLQHARLR